MTPPPRISIVIPMKNEAARIERCLEAVFSQQSSWPYEVIVVDSGSTDGSPETAQRFPVRLIRIPAEDFNHGLTRWLGARQARGEFIVFLVADAVPADSRWLERLVRPVAEDPGVAGAYSRQLVEPRADPIAAWHQLQWVASSPDPRVFGLDLNAPESATGSLGWFEQRDPRERHRLANFDDVASCVRRRALEAHPFRRVPWAEDLDFSLDAIRAGWRIVYAADSKVFHTHRTTVGYMLRRRWIDAHVISGYFGYTITPDWGEALRQAARLMILHRRAIRDRARGWIEALRWELCNPAVSGAMALGSWLGGYEPQAEGTAFHAVRAARRARVLEGAPEQVQPTQFTIGGLQWPVLMVHPNAAAAFRLRIPERARLSGWMGVKPEAHARVAPLRFRAELRVDRHLHPLVERRLDPQRNPADRGWIPFESDLGNWAGRRADLVLAVRSEGPTDFGWAGWGRTRILTPAKGWPERLGDWLHDRLLNRLQGRIIRHA